MLTATGTKQVLIRYFFQQINMQRETTPFEEEMMISKSSGPLSWSLKGEEKGAKEENMG